MKKYKYVGDRWKPKGLFKKALIHLNIEDNLHNTTLLQVIIENV